MAVSFCFWSHWEAIQRLPRPVASTRLCRQQHLIFSIWSSATEVPGSVLKFCDTMHEADGLICSSPMYNGTVSGSFKNALDWLHLLAIALPFFLTDKIVGLISTAGCVQGSQAVNTMEFVVRALEHFSYWCIGESCSLCGHSIKEWPHIADFATPQY